MNTHTTTKARLAPLLLATFLPLTAGLGAPPDLYTSFGSGGKVTGTFAAGRNAPRQTIVQPDGKIVVSGISATAGSTAFKVGLTRFTATGALDTTFGTSGKTLTPLGTFDPQGLIGGTGIVRQDDGKYLVCSATFDEATGYQFALLRYTANGILDTSFGTNGIVTTYFTAAPPADPDFDFSYPMAIALSPSGKIVVVGDKSLDGTDGGDIAVARFNSNGTLDTTFDTDGKRVYNLSGTSTDYARKVHVFADESIAVACQTFGPLSFAVLRLLPNGTPDTGFSGDGVVLTNPSGGGGADVHDMLTYPDGRIIVMGSTDGFADPERIALVRYTATGGLDTTAFGTAGTTGIVVTRLNSGTQDELFGNGASFQTDGKIVVGGSIVPVSGMEDYIIARYNSNGTPDITFNPSNPSSPSENRHLKRITVGKDVSASSTLVLGSGRILVTGSTYTSSSVQDLSLIQLQGDPLPDIAVEQPALTVHADNASTVDFGTALLNSATITKTFTIRNTGGSLLTLNPTITQLSGANPGAFTVTQPPVLTLAAGATTTFNVTFPPTSMGTKTATLTVNSNDPDAENVYTIQLTANVSGAVWLQSSAYAVVEGAALPIKIMRPAGGGTVTVELKTSNGAAPSATAGTDYTVINTLVTFTDMEMEKTVNLNTILNATSPPAVPAEPTENLVVTLSGGTAPKGTPLSAVVRIIDDTSVDGATLTDVVLPPIPSVSSPAQNALVPLVTGGAVNITGTATDARAVFSVEASLENTFGAPTPGAMANPGAASTAFVAPLVPVGSITAVPLVFRAYVRTRDYPNQSFGDPTSPVLQRDFRVSRPLVVTVDQPTKGSVPTTFAPVNSFREPGTLVTITATAKPNCVFDGWEVSGTGPGGMDYATPANWTHLGVTQTSLELATLTFKMQEGLELEAKFIDNPFPAATVAGTYNGLARATGGFLPGMATEGTLTVTVLTTGGFSAKLMIDGQTLNISGLFDNDGHARFGTGRTTDVVVPRVGKPSIILDYLDLDLATGMIDGHITQKYRSTNVAESIVFADRAHYAAGTLPNEYVGTYTAIIEPEPEASQPAPLTDEDYPTGCGYGTITISKAGVLSFTGTLADGTTPVTMSSTLSEGLHAGLFVQLYSKLGFLITNFLVDPSQEESDISCFTSLWSKPYQDIQHYPYGWPETVALNITAARYRTTFTTAPTIRSVLLAPDDYDTTEDGDQEGDALPVPGPGGNITLEIASPSMTGFIVAGVSIGTNDAVVELSGGDPRFSFSIKRATGMVTGTFINPDTNAGTPFNAMIYQKGEKAGAYGFFITPVPTVKTYDGYGGIVELRHVP